MKMHAGFNAKVWFDFTMEVDLPEGTDIDSVDIYELIEYDELKEAFDEALDEAVRTGDLEAFEPYQGESPSFYGFEED